jgi:hypothetical protein
MTLSSDVFGCSCIEWERKRPPPDLDTVTITISWEDAEGWRKCGNRKYGNYCVDDRLIRISHACRAALGEVE